MNPYQMPDLVACRSVEEIASGIDSMKGRLTEIQTQFGVQPLDDEARAEWAALDEAITDFESAKTEAEARLSKIDSLSRREENVERVRRYDAPHVVARKTPDNLYDMLEYRRRTTSQEAMSALMVDGAKRAAETWVFPHPNATEKGTVEHIHRLLAIPRSERAVENGWDSAKFAQHLLASGSPIYQRAFSKVLAGLPMTPEEQAAISVVGTTTSGGYMVPAQLDPTIILTSDGQVNPLRQIADVRQINTGNVLNLVTSAGVSAAYGSETAARTPTAPTLGQPSVTVYEASVLIDFSFAAGEDIPNLAAQLSPLIQDAKDSLEAEKFVNGTGSTQPEGVLYGIASTYNVGTTGDGLDLEDFGVITDRLADRWEPRASWLAHRAIYTEAERLDRAAGGGSANAYRPLVAGAPRELLGYPRYNSSAMESDFTTSTNRIAIFGDFRNYVIADRIGLSVEVIPHMVNSDGKVVGRGLLARFRNGAVVVVDSAFRVLTVGVVTTGV